HSHDKLKHIGHWANRLATPLTTTTAFEANRSTNRTVVTRDLFTNFNATHCDIAKVANFSIAIAAVINEAFRRLNDQCSMFIKRMSVSTLLLRHLRELLIRDCARKIPT